MCTAMCNDDKIKGCGYLLLTFKINDLDLNNTDLYFPYFFVCLFYSEKQLLHVAHAHVVHFYPVPTNSSFVLQVSCPLLAANELLRRKLHLISACNKKVAKGLKVTFRFPCLT